MNLKSRFKRIVKWNKYMSQSSNYIANDNLNVLIDPTFTNVNRLFVLSMIIKIIEFHFQHFIYQKSKLKTLM